MRTKYSVSILLSLSLFVLPNLSAAKELAKIKKRDSGFYAKEKIAISEIGGYGEAVGILESALASSLLDMYTENEQEAFYTISGNIFAKKHWRKRIYVYHTVDLRIADKEGNVVMSISNSEPMWQTDLNKFTDEIAQSLKESLQEAPVLAESRQETTKPILTALEVFPLKDASLVHMFQKSPKEQVRAYIGTLEGKTYLDVRVFKQVGQFSYMPTEEGITIPKELLPDLQQAVDSLQQKIGQTQSKQ
jgi:hypothetical protein